LFWLCWQHQKQAGLTPASFWIAVIVVASIGDAAAMAEMPRD
jgi:hypothetical protein